MNSNDFKKGLYLEFKGGIWQIIDFLHVFPGKGNAFVRTRLKNVQSGKVVEHTFKAGEEVPSASMETTDAQYLYQSGDKYIFMDNSTYEQFEIGTEELGDSTKYLKDGQSVMILKHNGVPINVTLPKKLQLKVIQAPPGVKGDSTAGATKQVTLETGLIINAPLFIKEGDTLVINTETGDYVERV